MYAKDCPEGCEHRCMICLLSLFIYLEGGCRQRKSQAGPPRLAQRRTPGSMSRMDYHDGPSQDQELDA